MVARSSPSLAPRLAVVASIVVTIASPTPAAGAGPGQGTDTMDWDSDPFFYDFNYAVHMALLPGDNNPYHSRILWFYGQPFTELGGGEWGWLVGNDGYGTFPTASFEVPPGDTQLFRAQKRMVLLAD